MLEINERSRGDQINSDLVGLCKMLGPAITLKLCTGLTVGNYCKWGSVRSLRNGGKCWTGQVNKRRT